MWRVPERRRLYKERKWAKIGYWERVSEKEHEVQLEKRAECYLNPVELLTVFQDIPHPSTNIAIVNYHIFMLLNDPKIF